MTESLRNFRLISLKLFKLKTLKFNTNEFI